MFVKAGLMNIIYYSIITAKSQKISINYIKLELLQLYKKFKNLRESIKLRQKLKMKTFHVYRD